MCAIDSNSISHHTGAKTEAEPFLNYLRSIKELHSATVSKDFSLERCESAVFNFEINFWYLHDMYQLSMTLKVHVIIDHYISYLVFQRDEQKFLWNKWRVCWGSTLLFGWPWKDKKPESQEKPWVRWAPQKSFKKPYFFQFIENWLPQPNYDHPKK